MVSRRVRRPTTHEWATVLLVVVGLLALLAAPAGAAQPSPYHRSDPVGVTAPCGTCVYQQPGDLTAITVVNRATSLKLKFKTRRGVDPFTSPNWNNNHTNATWNVYTGSGTWRYNVFLGNELVPEVLDLQNGPVSCPGATSSYTEPTYVVTVPKSCLGGMVNVRAQVDLSYYSGTDPDFDITFDTAPDNGPTPKITPS